MAAPASFDSNCRMVGPIQGAGNVTVPQFVQKRSMTNSNSPACIPGLGRNWAGLYGRWPLAATPCSKASASQPAMVSSKLSAAARRNRRIAVRGQRDLAPPHRRTGRRGGPADPRKALHGSLRVRGRDQSATTVISGFTGIGFRNRPDEPENAVPVAQ
jgi:hypothetical protein